MANLAKHYGVDSKAVRLGNLNKETEYVFKHLNMEAQELIEKVDEGQELILVDHNEKAQSVEGREKTKVLAVIDHHRIADFETNEPLYYLAKPYGCTSTILFEEYKNGYFKGHTANYIMVNAKGDLTDESKIVNKILNVQIEENKNEELYGNLSIV